jgi:hypothetical protein
MTVGPSGPSRVSQSIVIGSWRRGSFSVLSSGTACERRSRFPARPGGGYREGGSEAAPLVMVSSYYG